MELQIKILRAQLEYAGIDAAIKDTALRYAALQQQQVKAAAAVQKAVEEAQKACGERRHLDLDTMSCVERREKQ